jgi:ribosomal-protein-alanine N-acetyltransferase
MGQSRLLPPTAPAADIRLLTPDDVPRLRLDRQRRANEATVRQIIAGYPGRSVWSPETLEFVLVAPWRHRREVAAIDELAAVKHAGALLQAAVGQSRRAGDAMTLMLEMDELRPAAFYHRAGLRLIETVITYELLRVRPIAMPGALTVARAEPARPDHRAALLRIDHAAFPWLWWNSEEEFRIYGEAPGTELYIVAVDQRPIAYFGISIFPGWGHLDRIAVDPAAQGRGYGRLTLAAAVNVLRGTGARRIALSTQQANTRSQRLYESFGFRRSPGYDYRLYGTPVPAGVPRETAIAEPELTIAKSDAMMEMGG